MAFMAKENKGENIIILDVSKVISWTSYFCIVTAPNKSHNMALVTKLENMAAKKFQLNSKPNRCLSGEWEVLD